MIFDSADRNRDAAEVPDNAAKVSVQVISPIFRNHGITIFRAESRVVVKATIGGGHSSPSTFCAPLQGAHMIF